MAKVGAQRAAELTGKSKSTIQRAMKSGKISYEMDQNGRRVIDVAELERAFGLIPQGSSSESNNVEDELKKAADILEMERLKMRIKVIEDQLDLAKEQIEDLKEQRDQWQKQAQQVLLTSQYSQKQAEEMKAEMKERDRRYKALRQKQLEQQKSIKTMQGENENQQLGMMGQTQKEEDKSFDFQNLWHKLKGQNEKKASA